MLWTVQDCAVAGRMTTEAVRAALARHGIPKMKFAGHRAVLIRRDDWLNHLKAQSIR